MSRLATVGREILHLPTRLERGHVEVLVKTRDLCQMAFQPRFSLGKESGAQLIEQFLSRGKHFSSILGQRE
jgi:hypothetical protein